MITWIGFFAKVLETLLTKIAGKKIDLATDRRHLAAKRLLRFYEDLRQTSTLLDKLISVFDEACAVKKPVLFSKDLVPYEPRIIRLNDDLQRSFREVTGVIYIFDPKLSSLLTTVHSVKSVQLTAFGALLGKARLTIEHNGKHPFQKISVTTFRDEVATLDLNALMASTGPDEHSCEPVNQDVVHELAALLVEDEFTATDFEKVASLRDRLKTQKQHLDSAIALFREFLAANFNFSDLLGVGVKGDY